MTPPEVDGWDVNRKMILAELTRMGDELQAVREAFDMFRWRDLGELRTDIALLKFKASLWGGALGAIGGILVSVAAILLRLK